ncbi:protein Dok-7 [Elysia marginata]|uniref:Protein Dok-7 n=1 Tax=Elysia marginata TaxID=1093978 RepID=A0AAV4HNL3_9GAST|nr:protein Dok-7 [Elysia marginata]
MAEGSLVVDGKIKFREGKKWKPRWCILKKPSPVADLLQVILYKDVTEFRRADAKPKSVFSLDGFFGLNSGFSYDREPFVMAILCQKSISLMAFEYRDDMIQFEINIRQSLGEEHQFPVKMMKAPSSCRLPKDQVLLMIHDRRMCIVALTPPKILMVWNVDDLRRFGAQNGKFCFEGGEKCGKGSGVFAFQSEQAEDIADIVHLAATGKTSNCHRKFKNRSSQIDFASHPITDLSSSSSSFAHHPNSSNNTSSGRIPAQGTLPVNLNCCNDNQSNSADSEDWSWYKRHSVSVMDHRRIAALRESRHLDSGDQFSAGFYDVPPNNRLAMESSKNGSDGEPLYDSPRSNLIASTPTDDHGGYKKITHNVEATNIIKEQSPTADCAAEEMVTLPMNSATSGASKGDHLEKSSHEASLQRLKKQESDLHREMVLLDELLQNCASKNQDLASQSFDSSCKLKRNKHFQQQYGQINMEPLDQSVLAALDNDFAIISGNVAPTRPTTDENESYLPTHLNRNPALHLNKSLPDHTPLSPLFHAKLNNIPTASSWNRPLPYINLSKYDDESYSHVHLPGSADCVPPILRNCGAQGLLGIKAQSSSLSSLPIASRSSLNRSFPRDFQRTKFELPWQSSLSKQYPHTKMKTVEEQEVLVVDLNGESRLPEETLYATIQSPSSNESQNNSVVQSSELINILTSDAQYVNNDFSEEVVYENIPALRESPPPPQLPPKGPGLLKKLHTESKASDRDLTRNHAPAFSNSFSETSQYETVKVMKQEDDEKKSDLQESNYLIMGSPKLHCKHSVSFDHSLRTTSTFKNSLERSEKRGLCPKSDYMDMASGSTESFHEDEVYLDKYEGSVIKQRELYISEADLLLPAKGNGSKASLESAYMDMRTVTSRKPSADQIAEAGSGFASSSWVDNYKSLQDLSPVRPQPPSLPLPNEPPLLPKTKQNFSATNSSAQLDGMPCKRSSRVYVKRNAPAHNQSSPSIEPPKPFPNLINFSKKMSNSKSTYINTTLDSEQNLVPQETYVSKEVLLPEPVKEGFLARLKRRSSKEKSFSPSAEKSGSGKQRNSALERSMSEHESSKSTKEEKISKLKVGRRRSSSFPNRLSYQESVDGSFESNVPETADASSKKTSSSLRSQRGGPDQPERYSSVHDPSSESDISPLISRSKKATSESQYATVMLVSSSSTSVNPFTQHLSYGKPSKQDSSKTDDEKLIEMMQGEPGVKKPVIYQRSSSLELKKLNKSADHLQYLKVPKPSNGKERRRSFEKLFGIGFRNSNSAVVHKLSAQDISLPLSAMPAFSSSRAGSSSHLASIAQSSAPESSSFSGMSEDLPPSLPPKTKTYQNMLSPVTETAPKGFPPQPEPIYVEMDEVLSRFQRDPDKQKNQTRCLSQEPYLRPKSGSFNRGAFGKDRNTD